MNIVYIILTSLLTTILILICFFIAFLVISKSFFSKKKENKTKVKQKKADTLLLADIKVAFDTDNNPFDNVIDFKDLKETLTKVLDDKKIKKILIDVDTFSLTYTQIEELEPLFKELNKEKEVISLISMATNLEYYKALLADKIYLENTVNSSIILSGYFKKIHYMKDLLEKIGIKVNVLHIGDYKAYGENYSKNKMSLELKENTKRILDDRLNYFIDKVKERRNVDIKEKLLNGDYFFSFDSGLIDGRINKSLLFEKEEKLIEFSDYKKKKTKNKSKNSIALISLEGQVSKNEISLESVKEKIDKALEIKNLKGIVLEINSPGGSAYESSLIHSYIKEKVKVPIFVNMKDVCASGGYFIASVGKKIFLNNTTITGSIGVVSLYPVASKLSKKIGLNLDGLTKGKTTEFGHLTNHLDLDTKDLLIKHMNEVYMEFKKAVMKSRHISNERLEKIASGRVWTAKEAVNNSLADKILNTHETIEELGKYLNLNDYKIVRITKSFDMKKHFKKQIPFANYEELLYKPLMYYENELKGDYF